MKVVSITQSCLTVCNPMDCGLPGSSVHGILQARILEWVAIPFSRGSSQPSGIKSRSPALQADSLLSGPPRNITICKFWLQEIMRNLETEAKFTLSLCLSLPHPFPPSLSHSLFLSLSPSLSLSLSPVTTAKSVHFSQKVRWGFCSHQLSHPQLSGSS